MSYDYRVVNKNNDTVSIKNNDNITYYGGTIPVNKDMSPCEVNLLEFNTTYNYNYIIKEYLPKGFRTIYTTEEDINNKEICPLDKVLNICEDIIKKLSNEYALVLNKSIFDEKYSNKYTVQEMLNNSDTYDYWNVTPFNVIKTFSYLHNMITICKNEYPYDEYKTFRLIGD